MIADILNLDLRPIVESKGVQLHKTRVDYRSSCPIHKGEDKNAFAVWYEGDKWRWKCYSGNCGGGDVIDFIMVSEVLDIKQAIERLGGGKPISSEEARAAAEDRRKRAEVYEAQKKAEYQQALDELHKARAWERYCDNLCDCRDARQLWRSRGIPDDFQGYWELGYCPDFIYRHDDQTYHSPSLTIPIFNGEEMPANIRHRILKPVDPNDKYRPERSGLRALPFMADYMDPEHDHILIVEGEIKAMVTYICLDSGEWQVYGIPGKQAFRELAERVKGHQIWIAFDPDAREQAESAARMVNGRLVHLAMKIDDAINEGYLDKAHLRHLLTMAGSVK